MCEGHRGDGSQVLAVIGYLQPKLFELRPPKVVIQGGRHEKFWKEILSLTSWKACLSCSLCSTSLATFTLIALDIFSQTKGYSEWCIAYSCDQGWVFPCTGNVVWTLLSLNGTAISKCYYDCNDTDFQWVLLLLLLFWWLLLLLFFHFHTRVVHKCVRNQKKEKQKALNNNKLTP